MRKKKLKKKIRKLNKIIDTLQCENFALRDDVAELCEDYDSSISAIIRTGYKVNKAIENAAFFAHTEKPGLRGLFFK